MIDKVKSLIKRSDLLHQYGKRIYVIWLRKNRIKPKISEKLKSNFRGFTSDQYYLLNLKENIWSDYISERERIKTRELMGDYKVILDDKLIFSKYFSGEFEMPKILFYIHENNIYNFDGKKLNKEESIDIIKDQNNLFLKNKMGAGGKGSFKIIYNFLTDKFTVNDKSISESELLDFILDLDGYIAQELLTQLEYSNKIYSQSVNTIRILTMNDEGEVIIPVAMHRFGNDLIAPVDNASQGGIFCKIDLETGSLSEGRDYFNNTFYIHPDSKEKIEGKIIPNWSKILDGVKESASRHPYLPFLAWDIVVQEDGFTVVEINASTGYTFIQMWGGIRNGPIGEFFKKHEII